MCRPRSALAVLASSSGVSEERAAFMDLVQKEIDRLNTGLQTRGATSLIFQSGNVQVCWLEMAESQRAFLIWIL